MFAKDASRQLLAVDTGTDDQFFTNACQIPGPVQQCRGTPLECLPQLLDEQK